MKTLICTTPNRGAFDLKEGKKYEFVKVEHGIFDNSPYVTVKETDSNKTIGGIHFYRFSNDTDFLEAEYKKLLESSPFPYDY